MFGLCGWGVRGDPGHEVDDLLAVEVDYAEGLLVREGEGEAVGCGDEVSALLWSGAEEG